MDVNEESEITESFCEEEAPDEIPQSLLIYFETSRSRAVICERLILEDNDDCEEPYSVSSQDNDLDSLDQPQINSVLISGSNDTNSLPCHSPCTEEANGPEIDIEKTLEKDLTEESLNQEELWTERKRRVCDAKKMEEQRRQRESEFELELRRLEEAERMQQTELELMAKRAQAKLEQEMLLQQEMMTDLKKRVAEESRRRREEQAEFKREQERRREEERSKTEALRQRRRDTATQIQAEEMNAPLDLIRVDKVIMDGPGERGQEQEGEKAAVSHANNTHQDEAVKTCILETKWAKTQRLKDNVKEKDEPSGEDSNDRKVVANVSKREELQEIQSKLGKGRNGEMQEKGNIFGKEEEGANCDEDNNLHIKDGIETQERLVVQHNEKATIESKDTPKEIVKKKILISCNFLRNSLKFRQKAASNSGRDGCGINVETGEKSCEDTMMFSSNASPNVSKISQEKRPNSSRGNTGSRADHSLNEIREDDDQAAILETGNEGETGLKHNTLDTFENDQGNLKSKCREVQRSNKTSDTVQEDKLKKGKIRESNVDDKRGNADSTCEQSWSKERQGTSQTDNSSSPNGKLKYDHLKEKDAVKETSSNRKTSQNESNSTQKCGSNEKAAMYFYPNDLQTGNCEAEVYDLGKMEPNRNYTGKNAILETVNKVDFSVSIVQDGSKPDMDNAEREETKNEAEITSRYQSKTDMLELGDGSTDQATSSTCSLEKLSMKREEMPLNEAQVSRNLHEDEMFLNKTSTVSSVRSDFENGSEGLKEVGLLNCVQKMFSKSPKASLDEDIVTLTSTENTSEVKDSEKSNTAEMLRTVREDGKGTSEIAKVSSNEAATSRAGKEEEAPNVRAKTSEINDERHNMGLGGGSCWSGLCLPERTEQKRLRWMRECEPWSKLCVQKNLRKEQGAVLRRRGPKRAGGEGLPPLAPGTLLHNTGMTALAQLTTVILQDLSGCSLSTLSQCLCLQSLSLRRCGLRALEHVNKLHKLCSIDAQENEITFVDCENMSSLRVLRLGHNRLSSIHGLDGADNLTELDLSHNLITRIAGVESLRRLQSLSLSHNQLISSRGVSSLSSLLHLDLSQNQLDSVQGLDHCALLCTLRLSGNGLTQPPDLKNHVLLRELHLDDNSISSLHSLSQYWLPMMQHLTVAQNSLTELPSLCDFVSLETLDLRLNCLSELNGVCESLRKCLFIRDICLEGNPLQQEPGWSSILQTAAPGLRRIDGQLTDSPSAGPCCSPAAGSFLSLCRNQIQQTSELRQRHSSHISAASSPLDVLKISCRRLEEVFRLAEEHRFQHEFGDTSTTSESEREGSALEESSRDTQQTNEEAALIQQTPGPSTGTEETGERERAATVIQACWRGVSVRRRLRDALARARHPDPGWDEGLEEPDVDGFVLDEASLDTDGSLTLPDDFTERHFPVLERPPSPKPSEFFTGESLTVLPPVTDFRPKQAWTTDEQNIDIENIEEASLSDLDRFCSWTPYNVQDQSLSCQRNISPPSSAEVNGLPESTEKIMEEWGFKDANTALLMLKRARKMKSKREQQQKLKDPSVRLALFKRSASQTRPTEPRGPRAVVPGGEAGETATGHRDQPRDETHLTTSSESFLPRMSRAILNGGRVQLVTDPGRARVASQSCPAVSSAPRNNSDRRHEAELPCPKRGASTPLKKERISFRDNKLQLSGGWGSGKKRSKVCK